jgi:hypothetical protein
MSQGEPLPSLVPDLYPDPGAFQLDAGFVFVPLLAAFFTSFTATFGGHPFPLASGGLDAFLFAYATRAFLPTHAISVGRRGVEGGGGHQGGGARKRIQYHSHVRIL